MPVITSPVIATPDPTNLPVVGFDNVFEQPGSITADGSDYQNALDWLTTDGWTTAATSSTLTFTSSGSALAADYFAFAGHTLHTAGATIELWYWFGGGWVRATDASPATGDPVMLLFDRVASTKWQVRVYGAQATIGVMAAGERLRFQRGSYVGFVPPNLGHTDTILNQRSQNGQFLGRSTLRRGITGSFDLDYLTKAWVRSDLKPFIDHAREKAWFLLWRPESYGLEAAYCWTNESIRPRNSHPSFMAAAWSYEGHAPKD